MSKIMLLYTKKILSSVSFDKDLFYKELDKAYKFLLPHELKDLAEWIFEFTKSKPELKYCALKL
jgi:hypothetical protein